MQQTEVVGGVLVVTHKDAAALAQPGERPFDHPAPRLAPARSARTRVFSNGANVGDVARGLGRLASRGIVISLVEQQMLFLVLGPRDDNRQQRVFQAARIVPVGRRGTDA